MMSSSRRYIFYLKIFSILFLCIFLLFTCEILAFDQESGIRITNIHDEILDDSFISIDFDNAIIPNNFEGIISLWNNSGQDPMDFRWDSNKKGVKIYNENDFSVGTKYTLIIRGNYSGESQQEFFDSLFVNFFYKTKSDQVFDIVSIVPIDNLISKTEEISFTFNTELDESTIDDSISISTLDKSKYTAELSTDMKTVIIVPLSNETWNYAQGVINTILFSRKLKDKHHRALIREAKKEYVVDREQENPTIVGVTRVILKDNVYSEVSSELDQFRKGEMIRVQFSEEMETKYINYTGFMSINPAIDMNKFFDGEYLYLNPSFSSIEDQSIMISLNASYLLDKNENKVFEDYTFTFKYFPNKITSTFIIGGANPVEINNPSVVNNVQTLYALFSLSDASGDEYAGFDFSIKINQEEILTKDEMTAFFSSIKISSYYSYTATIPTITGFTWVLNTLSITVGDVLVSDESNEEFYYVLTIPQDVLFKYDKVFKDEIVFKFKGVITP